MAYEGMKQPVTNRIRDARTVVGHRNSDRAVEFRSRDYHTAVGGGCGFTRIQHQVVESALEFPRIKPSRYRAVAGHFNQSGVMPRVQSNRLHRSLDSFCDVSVSRAQRFARAGEFKQGIDEVRHQVHAGSNFLIQLFALRRGQVTVAKEFGVGDDSGKRMPQIVRNGTGHPPDGGKLFGLQQITLALEQAHAHTIEGTSKLSDFIAPARIEWMMEVSAFERAHAPDQISQRT